MFDIFLQVDSVAASGASAAKVETVWGLLSKGGPLMIPLGILFALAVFVFIERLLVIRKAGKNEENFMSIAKDRVRD